MTEIRLLFEKKDQARFISHLDLNRAFMRALFAIDAPLHFTEGFHRHPRLIFGQPLSLGMAGEREPLDIQMEEEVDPEGFREALNEHLPYGVHVVWAGKGTHSHREIALARYRMTVTGAQKEDFERFWQQDEISASKKTKRAEISFDLKPYLKNVAWTGGQDLVVRADFPASPDFSFGPGVLMTAFEKWLNRPIFCASVREGFLLEDGSDYR